MYEFVCTTCGKVASSSQRTTMSCSLSCRKVREANRYGRAIVVAKGISSSTVGAMSELLAAADLMRRGYAVFRALSPSCFCDLIAEKNGKTEMVEVRTGYRGSDGRLAFPKLKHDRVTMFCVVERNESSVNYIHPKTLEAINL